VDITGNTGIVVLDALLLLLLLEILKYGIDVVEGLVYFLAHLKR
jgi:hypothetical protein